MASEMASTMSSALSSAVSYPVEVFAEQYAVFLPWYEQVLARLEIQEWAVYYAALQACTKDSWKALVSTYQLWYLILRPPSIVSWIVLQHAGRFVGEHGGKSLQSLAIQTKNFTIWCVRFQMSLDKVQLLGEAGLVAMAVGLYYLRKWLQRQTYWARIVTWYKAKKRTVIRSISDLFDRLARVSKILALVTPHLLFAGVFVAIRLAFPEAVRYVTYETPLLLYLSVVYPFASTFLFIQNQRRQNKNIGDSSSSDGDDENLTETEYDAGSNAMSVSERKKKFERKKKDTDFAPEFINETQALATTRYWLNYWQVYAIVQGVGRCFSMTPIVGRFLTSHPIFHFLTGEFKLFFFVWVFGMEKILGSATSASADSFMVEARPLRLTQTFVTPLVLKLHAIVSDAINSDLWQKWVVSKTKASLDLAVMVRVLSEGRRDWLVHVTEEARVLTLPSITLLMPGFVTQFGVAYVRYAIPSAKSAQAKSKSAKLVYLQYWVLHCCVAGLLAYLEGILWWIPFSTHTVFLLWCYLILPQAIRYIYGMLESDLVAFGLLPKVDDSSDVTTGISETKIARLFDWVVSWLPAADAGTRSNENYNDTNAEEQGNQSATNSSRNSPKETTTEAESMGSDQLSCNGSDALAGNRAKDKDV